MKAAAAIVITTLLSACSKNKPDAESSRDAGLPARSETAEVSEPFNGPTPIPAEKTLRDYLGTKNCRDRLRYVVHPEHNEHAFDDWYKTKNDCSKGSNFTKIRSNVASPCELTKVGDHCLIDVERAEDPKTSSYELVRTESSLFKVDWRASVIYNPMTFPAFKAKGGTAPVLFRVWAKLDEYFNYAWSHAQDTHYSVRVQEPWTNNEIHSYVPKAGALKLFEALQDGKSHELMIRLSLRPSQPLDMADGELFSTDWHDSKDE